MNDWTCQICAITVRDRSRAPGYCPHCGLAYFRRAGEPEATPPRGTSPVSLDPPALRTSQPAPVADAQHRHFTPMPGASEPGREGQPARRVRPKEPLEVRLARSASLQALNISMTGLLVEDIRPFTPGWECDVELWRSGRRVRLRGEVVRCCVSGGGKGNRKGLRYHTGVRFLEIPQTILALVPELSEEP
jgi:hypothetical protein